MLIDANTEVLDTCIWIYSLTKELKKGGEIKKFGPRLKQNKLCFARIKGNFVRIEPAG